MPISTIMDRSRRSSSRGRDEVPSESRLTLRGRRRNKRRSEPLRDRLPALGRAPRAVVVTCGRVVRRAAPAVVVAAIAGGLGYGAWSGYRFITTSPRFAIDTIEVRGAHTLSPEQIRERVPVAPGDNLFTADLAAIEAALEREPWIADVEVRRRLPRAIEIDVREREAAARVDLDGIYLADRDGQIFKRARVDLGEGEGLPVITGVGRADLAAGAAPVSARIRRALATADAFAADGRPAIGEVRVDVRHGVTVYTYDDAVAIRLGDVEGAALDARLSRFDAAWAALTPDERRRARAIHLDHVTRPDHVTVAFNR
jgi:cell division protein FtsQ